MRTLLMFATAVAVLAAAPYAAQAQQTTFRDSHGSTVGYASRSDNQVTFRFPEDQEIFTEIDKLKA